jgi:hypothetical protein
MATPVWIGATSGQPQLANQVNQFLGTHAATYVYTGASFSSQGTTGSGSVNSNGLYVAQSFTTGSTTAMGRITLTMTTTAVPTPLTVQIRTNNAGAPSSTVLVSTVIPSPWATASVLAQSIPVPVTGLSTSTTYWIVTLPAGDVSDFYSFYKSNQVTGVSTSTNGTSWTAQTYGILYAAYDQSTVLPLVHTWEDGNARITLFTSNSNNTPSSIEEYAVAQGANQYAYSYRQYTYSGTMVTKIA